MKCHPACFSCMTFIYLLSLAEPAISDTLVIKYKSGKVQTVKMDEAAKDVQSFEFSEPSLAAPDKARDVPGKKQLPDEAGSKEPQPGAKKSGPTIKWAPPLSE